MEYFSFAQVGVRPDQWLEDFAGIPHSFGRRAVQGEVGTHDVTEHQFRIDGSGLVNCGDRIAAQRKDALKGTIKEVNAVLAATLDRHAPTIGPQSAHDSSSISADS